MAVREFRFYCSDGIEKRKEKKEEKTRGSNPFRRDPMNLANGKKKTRVHRALH